MIDPVRLLVLAMLATTLVLMLVRPGNWSEAWYACGGALGMIVIGAVPVDAVSDLVGQTRNVLLFLAGMMLLTGVAERAGLFAVLADGCVRLAHGDGRRLYVFLFLLGAVVTATLSLDVTVLMLTPIVATVAIRRKLDPVPFLFACVFVANTSSLVLPVSNLTNLLVFARLDPGFAAFVRTMWLPNLVAASVNLGIFLWLFRHRIPHRFATDDMAPLVLDPWLVVSASVTGATLVAIFALGMADRPLWWAAIGGGGLLATLAAVRGRLTIRQVKHDLSPGIFAFVLAMTVVVEGFRREFLAGRHIPIPHDPVLAAIVGIAGGAIGSNIVNNIPMTVLSLSIIDGVKPEIQHALAYGTLVGVNIGPTLTTYGSLATMLWLTLVRRREIAISTGDYLRVSLATIPAVLVATGLTLIVVLLA